MTTTTVENPSVILRRLRNYVRAVDEADKRHVEAKRKLYAETYLYVEAYMTYNRPADKAPANSRSKIPPSVFRNLTAELGKTPRYWQHCYRCGRLMRKAQLNDDVSLAAVTAVVKTQKIKPADMKDIAKALNDRRGPTEVRRMLKAKGYNATNYSTDVPKHKRESIRRTHKRWEDFKPQMEDLLREIAALTDGPVALDLVLLVDNEEVVVASRTPDTLAEPDPVLDELSEEVRKQIKQLQLYGEGITTVQYSKVIGKEISIARAQLNKLVEGGLGEWTKGKAGKAGGRPPMLFRLAQ